MNYKLISKTYLCVCALYWQWVCIFSFGNFGIDVSTGITWDGSVTAGPFQLKNNLESNPISN